MLIDEKNGDVGTFDEFIKSRFYSRYLSLYRDEIN